MRIPDAIMDGVVFLYRTVEEAKGHAKSGGTGFIVGKPVIKEGKRNGLYIPYLITNKHVAASCPVFRINRIDGRAPDVFELDERLWVTHPEGDDVAVVPILGMLDMSIHKATFGHFSYLITEEQAAAYKIGVGEEVCMIGRFVNHQGRRDSLAAARFGSVSVMPEPIWNTACLKDQLSYAVEMRSRTGFSGSPVIVYRTPATILTDVAVSDFWGFLGVNWGYIVDEEGENTWLNGVVPSWKIIDVFNTPQLKGFHASAEAAAPDANSGSAVPAVAGVEESAGLVPDNPSHREDFTRLLGAAVKEKK
jgi:hypothetical protein